MRRNSVLLWSKSLVKFSNALWLRLSQRKKGPQQNKDRCLGKDRTCIADFKDERADKLGDFPVNSTKYMVQDQSVNNTWKNRAGGLYDTFKKWKPSRQTMGEFYNDINSSFENLSQEKIRNAIDIQP